MNARIVPMLITALLTAVVSNATAQTAAPVAADPFAEPPPGPELPARREFLVRMEVFTLPQVEARRVMRQFPKQAELYAWLGAESEKEKPGVKLDHLSLIRVRDGRRGRLEEVAEYPYGTEYDPPQIPQTVGIGLPIGNATTVIKQPAPKPEPAPPEPVPKPSPAPAPVKPGPQGDPGTAGAVGPAPFPAGSVTPRVFSPWPYTPTNASSHTYKQTGWTVEIELTAGEDGRTVDLNIAPEYVKLCSLNPQNASGEILQPTFEMSQFRAQILATTGQPAFAGTFSPPVSTGVVNGNTDNNTRLMFLTVAPAQQGPDTFDPAARPKPAPRKAPADPFAGGDPGAPVAPKEGIVHLEAFSLPLAAARKGLLTLPRETDLYTWLDGAIEVKDSGVRLERDTALRVRGGQRSKSEAIHQFPYPTSIDPAQIPQTITLPASLNATMDPATGRVFAPWPMNGTTPTSFLTKNLGWTAEVELTFQDDGAFADLNLAPEFVRLATMIPQDLTGDYALPVFENQKCTTQVSAPIGRPALVSTLNPPVNTGIPNGNKDDRVWFLFATVTVPQ